MTKLKWLLITILLTAITLFTSVYAWLQVSNINILEDISIEVGVGDYLEISLDGVNYGKTIDKSTIGSSLKNFAFTDVTTTDNLNFYKGQNYRSKLAIKNVDYISLDLWFRVLPEQGVAEENIFNEIYLTNKIEVSYQEAKNSEISGTYVASEGKNWMADYTFDNGSSIVRKGTIDKYYAKEAMRIGFISNTNSFIYDVSENEARGYGKPFGAFDYYNLKNRSNKLKEPTVIPPTIYELSHEYPNTGIMNNDNSQIVVLERIGDYYLGNATLNIWIEGWDADAFDAILGDQILIQLEFITAKHIEIG